MSLIITFHPSYAFFSNPYEWGAFDVDLSRFARLLKGTLRAPPSALLTAPTVDDVLRLVHESQAIFPDIETGPEVPDKPWTGKDPTRARLRTVGLGNAKWGLSHKWEGGMLIEAEIKRVLEDESIVKCFQNGYHFDICVLKRYGIDVK